MSQVVRHRGAFCVVGPDAPVAETRGRVVLVLAAEGPPEAGQPGDALVSFQERPDVLAMIAHEHLLPLELRPCVSGDPRCCLLAPCEACLPVLRSHLKDALESAEITGASATAFVRRWNELRVAACEAALSVTEQARAWSASATERRPIEVVAEEARRRDAEVALLARQRAEVVASVDSPEPPQEPETTTGSALAPQVLHKQGGRKRSTSARSPRTKGVLDAASGPASSSEETAEPEAAKGSPGAEVVAGPRGG